jgi:hypothetical protein
VAPQNVAVERHGSTVAESTASVSGELPGGVYVTEYPAPFELAYQPMLLDVVGTVGVVGVSTDVTIRLVVDSMVVPVPVRSDAVQAGPLEASVDPPIPAIV